MDGLAVDFCHLGLRSQSEECLSLPSAVWTFILTIIEFCKC